MDWITFDVLSPANAGIVDFSSYLLGTLFIILLPGPNSLYVLTIATQKGWRFGAWGAIGIFIGDSVLMIAIALGAASLLMSSPVLFSLVRTLGALYLAWMGYGVLRSGQQRWTLGVNAGAYEIQARLMQLHPLLAALALSLTNPKAIFFFIAFFSQFIRPDFSNPAHTFIYLATVLQLMSMAYLAGLICVGQFFSKYFETRPRYAAALWIFAGILFIGFAVRLAIA
ncbi:leucine efflux protein LeuE [Polynucleobacter sp. AP-Kolm-20A-A1]|uniref:leucine efflux protein LeuE n=1 Tax=Polynucleobacter sp. AP-Kolm-20A-A1 TaxID=2081041 RepID=UPI001BFCF806|nr:leucine efflux protein LeuE [Polynucleobacter sp. AP-Kolm-20A-A1]QWE20097.1 leucine efflux protein LeuE [Polynucleobacter sp. AP-Kolm-20A-A1]